jgi:hypothetical protein
MSMACGRKVVRRVNDTPVRFWEGTTPEYVEKLPQILRKGTANTPLDGVNVAA